jgi:hypothetical protein
MGRTRPQTERIAISVPKMERPSILKILKANLMQEVFHMVVGLYTL